MQPAKRNMVRNPDRRNKDNTIKDVKMNVTCFEINDLQIVWAREIKDKIKRVKTLKHDHFHINR